MQLPLRNGRLISLYDIASWLAMEPFKADTFYKIGRLLEQVASGHAATGGVGDEFSVRVMRNESLDDPLSEIDKTSIQLVLIAIAKECAQVGLCRATQIAKDILHQFNMRRDWANREIVTLLRELDKHIRWDMEKEMFMYVPPSSARYYNLDKPFGEKVYDAFPSARFDLTQAGNCLAAGVHTAAGLHLMRGAEIGLWELGRDRQVPLAQAKKIEFAEWGTIIGELETAIKAIQQWPNSTAKEDAHKFYNRAIVEIRSFNDGIRRHLAHVRPQQIPLEEDEALANWGHVARFLQTLAAKISEGKYTDLVWK
ncbi:MAG TPA: hypothetical protein VFQ43_02610 [Nitrososphaera sp.]|nr:hypothetical protein [Nitrososphaera sp.]